MKEGIHPQYAEATVTWYQSVSRRMSEHRNGSEQNSPYVPQTVLCGAMLFPARAFALQAALAWSPVVTASGYKVYVRASVGTYGQLGNSGTTHEV